MKDLERGNEKLNYAEDYLKRGNLKYENKDFQGAIEDYDKAIELNPNLAGAYYKRGIAKGRLKEYDSATIDFNKAVDLDVIKYEKHQKIRIFKDSSTNINI